MFAQETGVVINGVTWATRNVGAPNTFANNPEDIGMYYQWNSKIGWTAEGVPSDETSIWNSAWNGNGAATWQTVNNPCPEGWHVPTVENLQSLLNTEWVSQIEPVKGTTFGDGDNTIFLPEYGILMEDNGSFGYSQSCYWSNSLQEGMVRHLTIQPSYNAAFLYNSSPAYGYSIRCVKDGGIGINEVSTDTENATVTGYFDILGRKLNEEPKQGIYIILYDNGKTKKVVK